MATAKKAASLPWYDGQLLYWSSDPSSSPSLPYELQLLEELDQFPAAAKQLLDSLGLHRLHKTRFPINLALLDDFFNSAAASGTTVTARVAGKPITISSEDVCELLQLQNRAASDQQQQYNEEEIWRKGENSVSSCVLCSSDEGMKQQQCATLRLLNLCFGACLNHSMPMWVSEEFQKTVVRALNGDGLAWAELFMDRLIELVRRKGRQPVLQAQLLSSLIFEMAESGRAQKDRFLELQEEDDHQGTFSYANNVVTQLLKECVAAFATMREADDRLACLEEPEAEEEAKRQCLSNLVAIEDWGDAFESHITQSLRNLQAELERAQREIVELQTQLAALQQERDEQAEEFKEEIHSMYRELDGVQKRSASQQQAISMLERQRAEDQQELHQSRQAIRMLERQRAADHQELQQSRQAANEQRELIDKLQQQLKTSPLLPPPSSNSTWVVELLQRKLELANNNVFQRDAELQRVDAQVQRREEEAQRQDRTINRLEREITYLRDQRRRHYRRDRSRSPL